MSNAKKHEDTDRAVPRMPHERDESTDSQHGGGPREILEKAYRDVEEGRQDTDRRGMRGYEKPENRVLKEKERKERSPRSDR